MPGIQVNGSFKCRCQAKKITSARIKRPRRGRFNLAGWTRPSALLCRTRSLRFRSISRRQASQLPRRCDIPAAWVPHKAHAVFYFGKIQRPFNLDRSISIVARRNRSVAAQGGTPVAFRRPRAILMRDVASRHARGRKIRSNDQAQYDLHHPSLARLIRQRPVT